MTAKLMKKRGMALFQVLLMVAIFSVLLLVMVAYTNQSVRQVQAAQDAVNARLSLHSAGSYLQFKLLTSNWLPSDANTVESLNFYSQPFFLQLPAQQFYRGNNQQVRVVLQDQNGLLDLRFPSPNLELLLRHVGVPASQSSLLLQILSEAQKPKDVVFSGRTEHKYPHLQIQSFSELQQLPEWDADVIGDIQPFVSLYGGIFNPAMAPDGLLSALLPSAQVDIIRQWRSDENFTFDNFTALTGIVQDDIVNFYPGNLLSIHLTNANATAEFSLVVKIDPYSDTPVVVFNYRYGN